MHRRLLQAPNTKPDPSLWLRLFRFPARRIAGGAGNVASLGAGARGFLGFAEGARHAVPDRLHQIFKERALSRPDVHFRRHAGLGLEVLHGKRLLFIELDPHDIDFPPLNGLQIVRQRVGRDVGDLAQQCRGRPPVQSRQADGGFLPDLDVIDVLPAGPGLR